MGSRRKRATDAELALRRSRCMKLRAGGTSYRMIAETEGIDKHQAYRDVQKAIAEEREQRSEDVETVRQLEKERLDTFVNLICSKLDGEISIADLVMLTKAMCLISQRRAKLFGLDAPVKVQNEVEITELQSIIREIRAEKDAAGSSESVA